MKKLILSIAFFVGFIVISNAQTSATGDVPPSKPQPVTLTTKPDAGTTSTSETKPATSSSTKAKKSNKKSCCKTKSDACCKKKDEGTKVD